ncbi:TIGR01777 family oxidoreductase [Rikenella microfusus]|uniref:TIGR01777 family oxidoreductase n=2 Tax=Rikenella microfusus TaxID=28139 RepID=UPI001DF93C60|nr:TIGR01777 family oxidoreductase [Rikenella microfusus]HJE89031.1 TIGR01777 family oxidoreductase [Rikenella microfusus]
MSGATGFVGSHLQKFLQERGHEIVPIGRELFVPEKRERLSEALSSCDTVINLAGAPLNRRWTAEYRREIYDSRIGTTRAIVEAIRSQEAKPDLFIFASAVGYYPAKGCYGESDARKGEGFLADVCRNREVEAIRVPPQVRCVIARFALIFAPDGGVFHRMAFPARHRIAVRLGSGQQHFAWIDLRDLMRAVEFVIQRPDICGPVNMAAPRRINNGPFTRALAERYRSWLVLPVPDLLLHLFMGEAAQLVLSGQCVYPER